MANWEISFFGWSGISGVYCVCEKTNGLNHILYIGSSKDIGKRLQSNLHPYKTLYNSGRSVFVKYRATNDYLRLEKMLIKRLRPQFNIQHNG